jgi:hypothetical protein
MNQRRRLVVSIDHQTLAVVEDGMVIREFPVSTAARGTGFRKDSFRTPTGRFRICEKIGGGLPLGTVFKARVPTGICHPGEPGHDDLILSRILRLDGLDAANANTLDRCVYVHGTNQEEFIGRPAGHGCIRLRNADMIELFDLTSPGELLEILPATIRRGKVLILTRCALFDPSAGMPHIAGGAAEFIRRAKEDGWLTVLLGDAGEPPLASLARELAVDHFEECPPENTDTCGTAAQATGGRMEQLIREWLEALLPQRSAILHGSSVPASMQSVPDVRINLSHPSTVIFTEGGPEMSVFQSADRLIDAISGSAPQSREA